MVFGMNSRKTLVKRSATAVYGWYERGWMYLSSSSTSSWILCAIGSAFLVFSIAYLQLLSSESARGIHFQELVTKTTTTGSSSAEIELIMWERGRELEASLANVTSIKKLHDKTTPQGKAFDWIVLTDPLQLPATSYHLVQRYVLGVLFYATAGQNWYHVKEVWLSGRHECNWVEEIRPSTSQRGVVQCDSDNRVRHLMLADNNLVGTLPSELSHLNWLNSLDLESNRLGGSIPSEVGLLTNLEFLALNNNKLQGEIPKTLANLKRMEQILLQLNDLSGTVTDEMCTIKEDLDLWNFATDCLPIEVGGVAPVKCDCCSYCCDGISHCSLPPA